jgi:hypothetical protein
VRRLSHWFGHFQLEEIDFLPLSPCGRGWHGRAKRVRDE